MLFSNGCVVFIDGWILFTLKKSVENLAEEKSDENREDQCARLAQVKIYILLSGTFDTCRPLESH
jgi:hypothetical protein